MASKTTNYNLDMPGYNEVADIDVINGNMDKIDVQMKKNADSAQQSKDIVSDKYSATNTYAVGDYCIHENVLYKCKTAITTGEEFDSNKWVQTTCGTEFKELNSNLDTLEFGKVSGTKNLFEDEIKWMENITVTRGTKSVSDGKITLTATSADCYTDHDVSLWKNNGIKTITCKPNTTYTLSWEYEGDSVGNIYIFENGSTNNMAYAINKAHKLLITTSADAEYLTFRVGVSNSGTSITYWNFQLEEGDTATPYEPYIPSVKMLAEENAQQNTEAMDLKMLGWTVPKECPVQNYVDSDGVFYHRVGRVDLGSLSFEYISIANRFYAKYIGFKADNTKTANCYCNKYKTVPWNDYAETSSLDKVIALETSGYIGIRDNSYTDANTLKNAMKGVYLYYELTEEKTISVDGNEAVTKVNESLDQLKNDLSGISFKIVQGTIADGSCVIAYPNGMTIDNSYLVGYKIIYSETSKIVHDNLAVELRNDGVHATVNASYNGKVLRCVLCHV